jgi:hypothetical protein
MFNSIVLISALALAIVLVAVSPGWGTAFLFIVFMFFAIMTYKGRCALLIGKDDCQIWDMYSIKEDDFWRDNLWSDQIEGKKKN